MPAKGMHAKDAMRQILGSNTKARRNYAGLQPRRWRVVHGVYLAAIPARFCENQAASTG
jgi:hypothetical protein